MCPPILSPPPLLPPHRIPLGCPRAPSSSALLHTSNLRWSSVLHMVICMFQCYSLFATLWTVVLQAPLSMRFSRQEYWSRLSFSSPRDLPDPKIKTESPALAGGCFTTWVTWKTYYVYFTTIEKLNGAAVWHCRLLFADTQLNHPSLGKVAGS